MQGTLNHHEIAERFFAFVTGLSQGHIESSDRVIAKAFARPGQEREGGVTGSV